MVKEVLDYTLMYEVDSPFFFCDRDQATAARQCMIYVVDLCFGPSGGVSGNDSECFLQLSYCESPKCRDLDPHNTSLIAMTITFRSLKNAADCGCKISGLMLQGLSNGIICFLRSLFLGQSTILARSSSQPLSQLQR